MKRIIKTDLGKLAIAMNSENETTNLHEKTVCVKFLVEYILGKIKGVKERSFR